VLKYITALSNLFRSILGLAVITIASVGGWTAYQAYFAGKLALQEAQRKLVQQAEEVRQLNEQMELQRRAIQRLQTANRFLKIDRRVARIDVVSQTGSMANNDLATKFTFVEVGPDGRDLYPPRTFPAIRGDVIYIDALVVKFDDRLVESRDDPLRSASVCLFRRVFGEFQQPSQGYVLDEPGVSPAAYRLGEKMTDFERELWAHFWDYAGDAARAERAGIRRAHGEAPFIRLMQGKRYIVSLRASGGLEIASEAVQAEKAG
jgi:hypothetical protein